MSMIDVSRLAGLSDKATLLTIRLVQDNFRAFTLAEILRFVAQKKMVGFSVNFMYAILAELVAANILTHEKAAPGKQAFYRLHESMSMSLNLSSALTKSNKNNDCACETLPNASPLSQEQQQHVSQLATQYGLTPAFLLEKVAERKAAGKPYSADILETTLAVAKAKATKDFAGLFFTMFVKRDVFASPYLAQEAGYTPPQPTARVIERPASKTPYKSNMAVTENVRPPVKSQAEQTQHYAKIADVIPPDLALAIDVKTLTDGLRAMNAAYQAGNQTAAQARDGVTALLGRFTPDVWQAAETTIQATLAAFDMPVKKTPPPVSQAKLATLTRTIGVC